MAGDAAVLLRKARIVENCHELAVKMRGHAQQRTYCDYTCPAYPRDENVEHPFARRDLWLREIAQADLCWGNRSIATRFAAIDSDEAGAIAFDAAVVLVAFRLVDPALATELGFKRLDGNAVRLDRAVTATLTDKIIDKQSFLGIRIKTALAPPALLCRAGLVIDQDSQPLGRTQFPLHGIQIIAVMDGRPFKLPRQMPVFLRLVRHDGYALCPFGGDLSGNDGHTHRPIMHLPACHRDGIVEQDFVGYVDARRRRRPYGNQPGMEISPVPDILKNMVFPRERRLPDPGCAFAAHLGDERRVSFGHGIGHAMTPDPGHGPAAFWNKR